MRIFTGDELMTVGSPTHHIRSWSGIIDPKDVWAIENNTVWAQLAQAEPHEPHFRLFASFKSGTQFMDVGANCGQSVMSIKAVNSSASIKSFEPSPFSFEIASKVVTRFSDAEIFNFGLSDRNTRLPIFTPVIDGLLVTPLASLDPNSFEPGGIMHRFLVDDIAQGADVGLLAHDIELRRGDDLGLCPDVIKIDVEGAELLVLDGLRNTITLHGPMIMTEKSDAPAIAHMLFQLDYDSYCWEGKEEAGFMMKSLKIARQMDMNVLPLNIFYVRRDKLDLYRTLGIRFDAQLQ